MMSLEKLRRIVTAAVALGTVALLGACSTPLDRSYGLSQTEYRVLSIENPEAGLETADAPRQDGVSTDSALTKYRKVETESREPEQGSIINVDIGG